MHAFVLLAALATSQVNPEAPKGPADWKVEVVLEQPKVNFCSVVCCAPDGRIFLAEDPMDMVGPPNQPIDRILCIHPDGRITVFAEKLFAVFGLVYMDGKLYVHNCPKFEVFDDGGDVGKNRTVLIDQTHPHPWGGMNDHIPSNMRLGMDGWFYMSTGDKGIYGAVGKDGSKVNIEGGGIMRFRPDGTHLEVFSTGTRNHLDVAINAEDEIFTYDNTDDGNGWWTRLTHMVDGGFYGYPYDYKPQRPYTLWMMQDFGGGAPTGGLCYNEDALPEEYRGNLFMCEWGKGQIDRFVVERSGGSYKIAKRDVMIKKGSKEFRPVGIAVSADGMSLYIADWNYGGWSNKTQKAGRLVKATYQGKSQAAPKPAWYLPAAMGQPFTATDAELIEGLKHPAQSVRFVAMRRIEDRGVKMLDAVVKLMEDRTAPPYARWTALWTLDRIDDIRKRDNVIALLKDPDPSMRRQAARQLGTRSAGDAVKELVKGLHDEDASVRFQAATALGHINSVQAIYIKALIDILGEEDAYVRYAAFTAIHRIASRHEGAIDSPPSAPAKDRPPVINDFPAQPQAGPTVRREEVASRWTLVAAGFKSEHTPIREGTLFAFRETYLPLAVDALVNASKDAKVDSEIRAEILDMLGQLSYKRPEWKAEWWGTQPVRGNPRARSVKWDGTDTAVAALKDRLTDSDSVVRIGAAKGMIASDSAALAVDVVKHLTTEKDKEAKKAMLAALVSVRNRSSEFTKAGNDLAARLLTDADSADLLNEALAFASSLPSLSKDVAVVMLKQSAGSSMKPKQLVTLLEGLAKSNDAEVTTALIEKTAARDNDVRKTAVGLIATRTGDGVCPALIAALKDKNAAVQKEAAQALAKRKDKTAIPALLDCLGDKTLRFDATMALAKTPDLRAVDVYLEGAGSKNNQQRDECRRALAAIKKEALPAIEKRLAVKPPLSGEVILQLQKIYNDVPSARTSPLFQIAAKTITVDEYNTAALNENGGNKDRGKKLFFDLKGSACVKCHKIKGEGGEVGPDLSSIATRYDRAKLIESVLYPSKQILDGYDMTIVATTDGKVIQGIVRGESGDELTLIDAESKKIVVKKADIDSRTKSTKSLMPDGVQVGMTLVEFSDLISYLESLREPTPPMPANKK
jgi:putative membrane-bound dehydrogenase-like protein